MKRMGIGQRIRETRIKRGYTNATAFARMIGITQASLWNLEIGKTQIPKGSTLMRIAGGLRVSQRWLMNGQGPKDPIESLTPQAIALAADWMLLAPASQRRILDGVKVLLDADKYLPEDRQVTKGTPEEVARLSKTAAKQTYLPNDITPRTKTRPPRKA